MKQARKAPSVLMAKEPGKRPLLDAESERCQTHLNASRRGRRESPIEKHDIVKEMPTTDPNHNESKSEHLPYDK